MVGSVCWLCTSACIFGIFEFSVCNVLYPKLSNVKASSLTFIQMSTFLNSIFQLSKVDMWNFQLSKVDKSNFSFNQRSTDETFNFQRFISRSLTCQPFSFQFSPLDTFNCFQTLKLWHFKLSSCKAWRDWGNVACDEVFCWSLDETAPSADLGGGSKDWRGYSFGAQSSWGSMLLWLKCLRL